jgi:hypothetical protein
MAKFGFDTSEVDVNAQGSFDPMPEGEYILEATDAEEKQTKAGTGSYLSVTFKVSQAEFNGRKVWMNFNINNPSEKAQSIGRQQLVSWATAAGKPNASDSDQLIGRKFKCALGIEKSAGYSDKNNIKAFLFDKAEAAASDTPKAAAKPAPAKALAPASKAANPWD